MIKILIRIILDAQQKGRIKGFQLSQDLSITHLLFVDDVLLFGIATVNEWCAFKEALDLFCSVFGMVASMEKSSFLFQNVDVGTQCQIAQFLPYRMDPIQIGFKYLGFFLKPLGYHSSDWNWMVERFEKRIKKWSYRLLSLGFGVVLINSVLSGLAIYWFSLARCPHSILNRLRQVISSFLWGSVEGHLKYQLAS